MNIQLFLHVPENKAQSSTQLQKQAINEFLNSTEHTEFIPAFYIASNGVHIAHKVLKNDDYTPLPSDKPDNNNPYRLAILNQSEPTSISKRYAKPKVTVIDNRLGDE